jgi:hypothetical protein
LNVARAAVLFFVAQRQRCAILYWLRLSVVWLLFGAAGGGPWSLKHDLAITFTSSSLRAERSNLVQIEIPGSEIASSLRSSQ